MNVETVEERNVEEYRRCFGHRRRSIVTAVGVEALAALRVL